MRSRALPLRIPVKRNVSTVNEVLFVHRGTLRNQYGCGRLAILLAAGIVVIAGWGFGQPGTVALWQNRMGTVPAEAADPPTTPGQTVFHLRYTTYTLPVSVSIGAKDQEIVFKKTPDFQGREIVKGYLPTGMSKKDYTCYAIDLTGGTLYLDLNRNLDLTDDPGGVYHGQKDNRQSNYSVLSFGSLRLTFPTAGKDKRVYQFSLICVHFGEQTQTNVTVQSGWSGKIRLGGMEYTCWITDNLDGWLKRGDVFEVLSSGTPDPFSSSSVLWPPSRLFMNGHDYSMGYAFVDRPNSVACDLAVSLKESHPPMGRVHLEGGGIHRLILESGKRVAMWDSPSSGVFAVPADTYPVRMCFLKEEKRNFSFSGTGTGALTVREGGETRLQMGAPVVPALTVSRFGRRLNVDFKLVGIGGEVYTASMISPPAPTVHVFKGDKEIASGTLAYG